MTFQCETLEQRVLLSHYPGSYHAGDHDAYASGGAYRDDHDVGDYASDGRDWVSTHASISVSVGGMGPDGVSGLAQASLEPIGPAGDAGKEWRLFASAKSAGGTEGGCPPATPNCKHASATAEAQFFDTITVGAGTSGLPVGTLVPLYLVVRANGVGQNLPDGYYQGGAKLFDFRSDGTTRIRGVASWGGETNGQFNHDGVFPMGMALIGQQIGINGAVDVLAASGGSISGLPQRWAQVTTIYNVAADIPGIELSSQTGWYNDSDLDDDGLLDPWEEYGYDDDRNGVNDVPLNEMGASFMGKDIFVESDYMEDATHTHKPDLAAIQTVVDAFDAAPVENPKYADGTLSPAGISLHVDLGPDSIMDPITLATWQDLSQSNALPEDPMLLTEDSEGNYILDEFNQLRESHFAQERQPVFHYALWAHNIPNAGGVSIGLPASDFILALGAPSNSDAHRVDQAATLMHELGHNLGLDHGGDEAVNDKPNYLSVMNYSMAHAGLTIGGVSGVMDYSRFDSTEIPDLVETNLNESVGLNGSSIVDSYGVIYHCGGTSVSHLDHANGPINWNCLGVPFEPRVREDINNDNHFGRLHSFDDWAHLVFNGGQIGRSSGTVAPPVRARSSEPTPEDEARYESLIRITLGADLTTSEAGATASFTVVLGEQPTADVTIDLMPENPSEGTPSVLSLVFTPANWNVARTVTVTGVDDLDEDGDVVYGVVIAKAVSNDFTFSGLDPLDVWLVNSDNEINTLPSVTNAFLHIDLPAQALKITFSENVFDSLSTNDLQLLNLGTGELVSTANLVFNYYDSANTATFALRNYPGDTLPDGAYALSIAANDIHDIAMAEMATDFTFDFVVVNAGGSLALPAGVHGTNQIAIGAGGQLDLGSSAVVIDYAGATPVGSWNGSGYTDVSGMIASGRNGGSWNGSGIVTSSASGNFTTVGVAEIDGDVVVKFTYGGDANLDGKINVDDYGRIDGNVGQSGSVFGWDKGDFNYDGKINIDDYGIIDGNIGQVPAPVQVVIEPSGLGQEEAIRPATQIRHPHLALPQISLVSAWSGLNVQDEDLNPGNIAYCGIIGGNIARQDTIL